MGEAKRRKTELGDKYWAGQTKWNKAKSSQTKTKLDANLPDLGQAVFEQVGNCPVHYRFCYFYTGKNGITLNQSSDISTVTLLPNALALTRSDNGDRLPIIFGAHILTVECPASFMTAQQLANTVLSTDGVDLIANNASRYTANNGDIVVPFNLADCPMVVMDSKEKLEQWKAKNC